LKCSVSPDDRGGEDDRGNGPAFRHSLVGGIALDDVVLLSISTIPVVLPAASSFLRV
jgi:hypothetical protein